jgi:uncharacterized repeat protein (TIGR01451 family)
MRRFSSWLGVSVCAALPLTACLVAAPAAQAAQGAIVVDTSPGTGSPPPTLGGYTMTPFPADPQPVGTQVSSVASPLSGSVSFSPSLLHDTIGNGWDSWSNGYTGDVYDTTLNPDPTSATLTLPSGTGAFYFYAEPNQFATLDITATAQDGTSTTVAVNGDAGAQYFGFYGTGSDTVASIAVSTTDPFGFAVGEFGISAVPDLSITNAAPATVVSGKTLTYTITATNTGGGTATGVTVTDPLPTSAVFGSASTTQGTCTRTVSGSPKTKGGTVSCSVGGLGAGQSATITLVVKPTTPGTLTDTATVTASNVSQDADDSATATTTVQGT